MKTAKHATLDTATKAGRPRDVRLDAAIAAATVELIAERGYSGLSLKAVAERAGTSTPAIYRRWSSKAELVLEAVLQTGGRDVVADTGDLEADVRTMIGWTLQKIGHPVARAAVAGLLGEHADAQRALRVQLNGIWNVVGERLQRAVDAGEIRTDLDIALQVAALAGPAFLTALFQNGTATDAGLVDALTSMALNGIRQAPHKIDGIDDTLVNH